MEDPVAPLVGNVVNRRWRYDNAFNVTGIDDGRWGKSRYQYDANDQICQSDTGMIYGHALQYIYDENHNLAGTRKMAPDSVSPEDKIRFQSRGGRVIRCGENYYFYNEQGQLTEKRIRTEGYRPRVWKYRWNIEGQLTELMTPQKTRWRYAYDAFGRRIRKFQVISTGAPGTERQGKIAGYDYLWQGEQLTGEIPLYADGTPAEDAAIHWLYRREK